MMQKLILTTEAQGKVAYEFAEHSITIGRPSENMIVIDDRLAVLSIAAIAALAFLGSMIAVHFMDAP